MTIIKTTHLLMPTASLPGAKPFQEPQQGDFATHLKNALRDVNNLPQQAAQAIEQLAGEGKGEMYGNTAGLEKADVSFRLMMQIRNKVLEAYQEIMRMQV